MTLAPEFLSGFIIHPVFQEMKRFRRLDLHFAPQLSPPFLFLGVNSFLQIAGHKGVEMDLYPG